MIPMKTLGEIIDRHIEPIRRDKKREQEQILDGPLALDPADKLPAQYEVDVFNYLVKNKTDLGITSVTRFKNRLVDGAILLSDERRFVLEIKLRMGWLKACQAEWQVRQFFKRTGEQDAQRYQGAVVVFERFSGDWDRRATKDAKHPWGWDAWYFAHHDSVDEKPMSLVMFSKKNGLANYPEA
jgi:hypothetical protein